MQREAPELLYPVSDLHKRAHGLHMVNHHSEDVEHSLQLGSG